MPEFLFLIKYSTVTQKDEGSNEKTLMFLLVIFTHSSQDYVALVARQLNKTANYNSWDGVFHVFSDISTSHVNWDALKYKDVWWILTDCSSPNEKVFPCLLNFLLILLASSKSRACMSDSNAIHLPLMIEACVFGVCSELTTDLSVIIQRLDWLNTENSWPLTWLNTCTAFMLNY